MSIALNALKDTTWNHKRKLFIGVLLFSIVVHFLGGIGAAVYVVMEYFAPPKAQFVANRQLVLPPQIIDPNLAVAEFEAAASKPVLDQKLSSMRPTEFSLPDVPEMDVDQEVEFDPADIQAEVVNALGEGSGLGDGAGGEGGASTFFGFKERSGSMLKGHLYDFKQTSDRKPTKADYHRVLIEFLDSNWNPRVFRQFFKSPKPLYLNHVYIPHMRADEAPKAFEVEKEVEPIAWVAHYEGKASSPASGRWRFAGFADDILIVRLNKRVVFDGSYPISYKHLRKHTVDRTAKGKIANGECQFGPWINLESGKIYDWEILVGERPGGWFSAILMMQEEGEKYRDGRSGVPIMPLVRFSKAKPREVNNKYVPEVAMKSSFYWGMTPPKDPFDLN